MLIPASESHSCSLACKSRKCTQHANEVLWLYKCAKRVCCFIAMREKQPVV